MRLVATLCALLCATTVNAQSVAPCDARVEPDAIPEPWSEYSRAFANGEVRLAVIDTIEPAATPFYLMILHPPRGPLGARRCTMIGFSDGYGYQTLHFEDLTSTYDPARGLVFTLPGRLYDAQSSFSNALRLTVSVNQATGAVQASHELGND